MTAAEPTRRYTLSSGGRPRSGPDYVELLVARGVGRNLTALQGCVVQGIAIVVIVGGFWALLASGLFMDIVEPFTRWYTEQAFPRPSGTP